MGEGGPRQVPIREGLFSWPSAEPHLLASRCDACGTVSWPSTSTCANPHCRGGAIATIELSRRGRLDSYTIMRYQPPPPWRGPQSLVPLGQGFVTLPEGIAVAAVFTTADPAELTPGREMELVVERLYDDEEGNEVMSYRFRPVGPIAEHEGRP
jgi:uncharacterized OB-fold protein